MSDPGSLLVIAGHPDDPPVALRRGLELARRSGAAIRLVTLVWDAIVQQPKLLPETARKGAKKSMLDQAKAALEQQLAQENSSGVEVSVQAAWARDPADWVSQHLKSQPAAMVVKAADSGRDGRRRTQADWALLRQISTPVLLAVQSAWPKHPNVLAAVDLSNQATSQQRLNEKVVQQACVLARQFEGELHLVFAIEFSTVLADLDVIHPELLVRKTKKAAAAQIKTLRERYGIKARNVHLPVGKVENAINSVADRTKCRLMVLGTSARRGVRGLVIGNTAEEVLENCNTDILTLKA